MTIRSDASASVVNTMAAAVTVAVMVLGGKSVMTIFPGSVSVVIVVTVTTGTVVLMVSTLDGPVMEITVVVATPTKVLVQGGPAIVTVVELVAPPDVTIDILSCRPIREEQNEVALSSRRTSLHSPISSRAVMPGSTCPPTSSTIIVRVKKNHPIFTIRSISVCGGLYSSSGGGERLEIDSASQRIEAY